MRVLSQGQSDLFDSCSCAAAGRAAGEIPQDLHADGTRLVALACRAAGIDRSVFATVYNSRARRARTMVGSWRPTRRKPTGFSPA